MKVVNDTAERAVKVMSEFNEILTNNNEKVKQFLLQVVRDYRNQFPSHDKKELVGKQ